jgi:hypothetical protein
VDRTALQVGTGTEVGGGSPLSSDPGGEDVDIVDTDEQVDMVDTDEDGEVDSVDEEDADMETAK